ncbi:MAG: P-II family nitrogen regulator, partial [Caldilineaceae bacterium]
LEVYDLLRKLTAAGVTGYTLIRAVEGSGERGRRSGDELTGIMQNSLIIIACSPELAERITEVVLPVLRRFGGVCLVSDAEWVEH